MDEQEQTIEQARDAFEKYGRLSDDALILEIAKGIQEAKKNGTYNRAEIFDTLKNFEGILGAERVDKILEMLTEAERI